MDAVSGGIASLIDLAWQIFCFDSIDAEFVVTMDEPENHLHPELQRQVLTNLLVSFPQVQFIVATHNPFVLGSVPDSNVYVLRYSDRHTVISELLEDANRSGSANEILRDVLGVESAAPIWVNVRLQAIIDRYSKMKIDETSAERLRAELESQGLAKYFPDALASLLESKTP